MLDLDQFVADCRAALVGDATHKSVREVVARAVSDPRAVLKGLGEPQRSGVQKIYQSHDLTILNVIWGTRMTIWPHNHQMWAVIGIYTGREDNIFGVGFQAARLKQRARGRFAKRMRSLSGTTSFIQ